VFRSNLAFPQAGLWASSALEELELLTPAFRLIPELTESDVSVAVVTPEQAKRDGLEWTEDRIHTDRLALLRADVPYDPQQLAEWMSSQGTRAAQMSERELALYMLEAPMQKTAGDLVLASPSLFPSRAR